MTGTRKKTQQGTLKDVYLKEKLGITLLSPSNSCDVWVSTIFVIARRGGHTGISDY
jgi:response regulator of citrate/malate metabolism